MEYVYFPFNGGDIKKKELCILMLGIHIMWMNVAVLKTSFGSIYLVCRCFFSWYCFVLLSFGHCTRINI